MAKMLGNGSTLAFSGTIAGIQSMDMPNWAGEDVDVTDLDSTLFLEYLYNGLADGGEVSADIFMDPDALPPAPDGTVGDITITNTDGTKVRTIAGSGYCRESSFGNASPGEAIVGTVVLKFDGITTQPNVTVSP